MKKFNTNFLVLLLLLGGSLAMLCHQGFLPYQVMWGNDLPLGNISEASSRPPGSFFGCWMDFYWIGWPNPGYPFSLTNISLALLGPAWHLKTIVPVSMFFLGFGAWFFFRQLKFSPLACAIGGLGAGLNMHYFSNGCWGVYNWTMCAGMIFVALGILVSDNIRPFWLKGVLAGFAVGVAVMDGYDVGAIMSVYVGIFVVFHFLTAEEPMADRVRHTVLAALLVVFCSALISYSDISNLISTQLKGTAAENQSEADKQAAWTFNTQFSIPKLETLRVIIPGLMGYRMQDYSTSTNPAAYYWGDVAADPRIDDLNSSDATVRTRAVADMHLPEQVVTIMAGNDLEKRKELVSEIVDHFGMQRRHTGNGEYAGVLVCLFAVFGLVNSWRPRATSPFNNRERLSVWFWAGAGLFSLLVAWGRHAFLYYFVYHVPFISTFRNPEKYMHPFNLCLMILAGYGLEAACRRYMAEPSSKSVPFVRQLASWWKRVSTFEKGWAAGCAIVLVSAIAGYLILRASHAALADHIAHSGFDKTAAPQIADFCINQVGTFVIYLTLSFLVLISMMGGLWAGRRAIWAWVFLGAIMICDLSRADSPWIRYYNYKEKLSMNPVVDLLRVKPWEHRVDSRVWPSPGGVYLSQQLTGLCHWWLENDYPFNEIQCLEIDQAPRMPVIDNNYLNPFFVSTIQDLHLATRLWQLTNTRYIFADTNWAAMLNEVGEPRGSFKTVMLMNVAYKPGITQPEDNGDITVVTNNKGPYALLEFTHALPRTRLYANWKNMDDATTVPMLRSSAFDPEKTVLVAQETPVAGTPLSPGTDAGAADISHYESKDIVIEADAKTNAVLLLNDRTDFPKNSWCVWVDQKPAPVLRCNYIMRGVYLTAGKHTVEFRYQPPLAWFYVTLATFALGVCLAGYVIVTNRRRPPEEEAAEPDKK